MEAKAFHLWRGNGSLEKALGQFGGNLILSHMRAVLAVFRTEVYQTVFLVSTLFLVLATPHISEGFWPETGICYVAQFVV